MDEWTGRWTAALKNNSPQKDALRGGQHVKVININHSLL
jgi:hypothetical protein